MYVEQNYHLTHQELDNHLRNVGDNVSWCDLLMVDYVYHNQEQNYDAGLSFIDRLIRKLGRFHPEWNSDNIKDRIRNANYPQGEYVRVIQEMLNDPSDIAYYGV